MKYGVLDAEPTLLQETVAELRHPENIGANVTIPFKEAVLPLLDQVDDMARDIGAVNAIAKVNSSLIGYNTDAQGFLRALKSEGGFDPEGNTSVILGAGGAAKAVCHALLAAGVSSLTLANRTLWRVEELASRLRHVAREMSWKGAIDVVTADGPGLDRWLAACDIVVNCTPTGMKHGVQEEKSPLREEQIRPGVLVCDLVYNPAETPLLKVAARAGARTIGGLSMLIYQGAAAFQLWTGKEAPVEIMFEAARGALDG